MKNLYLGIILLFIIVSCSGNRQEKGTVESSKSKLTVVATTGMLYDAVLNIAGEKVEAEAIMGPGVDPHLYKATQGDLSKLRKADIIIYNGLLLEGKMGEILEKLGQQKPVLAAAESIDKANLNKAVGYKDAFDPHVWFDVSLWKEVVINISKNLSAIDTANASYYQTNSIEYLSTLDTLDSYVKRRIMEIPESQRVLITAHDAFGYFGEAYGMEVKGLQGISTVSDFGLKDIADLTDLIISRNIKAIFVETSVSDKSINAVIKGCQEKGHKVVIGGSLYSDAMGEFGTFEGTYVGMFKHNVDIIVESLK